MVATELNPQYEIWAGMHNNTPEEQLEVDYREYPGGSMSGFIMWINKKGREFSARFGYPVEIAIMAHQDKFAEWLESNPH